jgi:hypothetical protein
MRRTTPDLVGRRQSTYLTASRVLLGLTVLYVLWTNYVVFVGGNLPLTPIDLGGGSTGAGLFMLAVGDLIAVLIIWFVIDAALLNVLHLVLRRGSGSRRPIPVPNRNAQPVGTPAGPPFAPYPNANPNLDPNQNPGAQQQQWNAPPPGAQQGPYGQQGSTIVSQPGSAWPPPSASGPDGR